MNLFRRWLNGRSPSPPIPLPDNLPDLHRQILQCFNRNEIRDLCFRLHISFDELPEAGLTRQTWALLEMCRSNGRLPDLMAQLREMRPNVAWID